MFSCVAAGMSSKELGIPLSVCVKKVGGRIDEVGVFYL